MAMSSRPDTLERSGKMWGLGWRADEETTVVRERRKRVVKEDSDYVVPVKI